jgi:hypothetical protein
LAPPRRGGSKSYLDCSDQDIYAIHISPTDPTFEFEWILLTSLTVETFDEALEIIWIYKQRWHIECVHKTLKSGFRAEQLTLNHRDKLSKAIAIFLPCAVHVYWMAHKCRHQPEASADTILTKTECLLLSLKNKESKEYIPTIKEAWLWISLMGGFRGSKNSAPPGQIVFWRGLRKLKDMAIGASLIVESLK